MTPSADDFDHDVVVVGSGFGGSVSALRLAEKGWKVALLEQGRRLSPEDLERAGTDARALAWMPSLGRSGPLAQEVFQHVGIVRGIGLGGGSLVYAAALLRPQEAFFTDPAWPDAEGGWQAELAPHYATAERMLGLATNPYPGLQDEWLRETARRMGGGAQLRACATRHFLWCTGPRTCRSLFCRARSGAQGVRALWPLHHRLCGGRQKLVGQELPSPG